MDYSTVKLPGRSNPHRKYPPIRFPETLLFYFTPYQNLRQPLRSFFHKAPPGGCLSHSLLDESSRSFGHSYMAFPKRKVCVKILSLTVSRLKNRCIPCIFWGTAIFIVVTKYSNLFFPFTFFLNGSHIAFGYELIIRSETTDFMESIRDKLPPV